MTGSDFDLSDDHCAKTHCVGRIVEGDLDDVGASCCLRLRRNLANMAGGNDRRVIRRGDGYFRILRAR
jgi:hypothetical protein